MRAALGKRQSTHKKIRPVNPITRYGKAVGSIFRWLVFEEASLIGNDQEAPMSGPGRQITVTIPHDVGFDLKKIPKKSRPIWSPVSGIPAVTPASTSCSSRNRSSWSTRGRWNFMYPDGRKRREDRVG